jgi:putative glutamine amidotransferase
MTILVVNDYDGLYTPFWAQLGGDITSDTSILLRATHDVGLICFTGGADVSPELYGHKDLGSYTNPKRDEEERSIFALATQERIPMTGICRGAQLLNALCGGTLVQDLPGHQACKHLIYAQQSGTPEYLELLCAGDHHQMIVPGALGTVAAYAVDPMGVDDCTYDGELRDSNVHLADDHGEQLYVTEAIAYPHRKVFAVQFHPEWVDFAEPSGQWTLEMTRKICLRGEV